MIFCLNGSSVAVLSHLLEKKTPTNQPTGVFSPSKIFASRFSRIHSGKSSAKFPVETEPCVCVPSLVIETNLLLIKIIRQGLVKASLITHLGEGCPNFDEIIHDGDLWNKALMSC